MLLYIGLILIGLVVGIGMTIFIFEKKSSGSLLVYPSDDSDPYFFLELSKDPYAIMQKKYVTMKVNVKDQLSHK